MTRTADLRPRQIRNFIEEHTSSSSFPLLTNQEENLSRSLQEQTLDCDHKLSLLEVMADQTLKELAAPDLNQQPLCILYPNLRTSLKLHSGFIQLLPIFRGHAGEDPHRHLKEFHMAFLQLIKV